MLIAFTNTCSFGSFEPLTTKAFPLAAHNSLATESAALSNVFAEAETEEPPANAATLLYSVATAADNSLGFTL